MVARESIRELASRTGLSLAEASRFRTTETMRAFSNRTRDVFGTAFALAAIVGLGLATVFHP